MTNDALEATWLGFAFWLMAVKRAGSIRPREVRAALQGLSLAAPSGFQIAITPDQHTSLPAFVGQVTADRTIVPVWASGGTRDPDGRERHAEAQILVA